MSKASDRARVTRQRLLTDATRLFAERGYEDTSIEAILHEAGVSRGSLYHHFGSKEALGHAIIEEVIAKRHRDQWLRPLEQSKDPVDTLVGVVRGISIQPEAVRGGCELLNLAQEMSPLDEGFRKRLEGIFRAWREAIAMALRRGQSQGTVRRDVVPEETAGFLIAMVEGYGSLTKNAQDVNVMKAGIRNIVDWLQSLRVPGNRKRG